MEMKMVGVLSLVAGINFFWGSNRGTAGGPEVAVYGTQEERRLAQARQNLEEVWGRPANQQRRADDVQAMMRALPKDEFEGLRRGFRCEGEAREPVLAPARRGKFGAGDSLALRGFYSESDAAGPLHTGDFGSERDAGSHLALGAHADLRSLREQARYFEEKSAALQARLDEMEKLFHDASGQAAAAAPQRGSDRRALEMPCETWPSDHDAPGQAGSVAAPHRGLEQKARKTARDLKESVV